MFRFCNLFSGSSGNCSLVETENTKILVDCGMSSKKIDEALKLKDLSLKDINGIIITHEHSDHTKGLTTISKNYKIPIYANEETFKNIKLDLSKTKKIKFKTNSDFEINDLKIHSFSIPHDAADPCGFNIFHDDKKISIATDIGHITTPIFKALQGSDFLLLESNYEPEMLRCSRYPYLLKKRIMGPNGHLSNEEAGTIINELIKYGVNNITLGHLSKQNNFPELAYQTVMNEIISKNTSINNLKLNTARRDTPDETIIIK